MPITVERLPDEPILIAVFSGDTTIKEIRDMYHESAALMGNEHSIFYRISDLRTSTSMADFGSMVKMISAAAVELSVSTAEDRIEVTLIGKSGWISLGRDFFARRGMTLSVFEDMETALESVRFRIANEKKNVSERLS